MRAPLVPAASPSLVERAGTPLPAGDVLAGTTPAVIVATPTFHPSDVVQVVLRRGEAPARVLRAVRDPVTAQAPGQWFRALLPVLQPGDCERYRVEWSRSGRSIATLPADGSWYDLRGVAGPHGPDSGVSALSTEDAWASRPRFDYHLEFFAALTVNLRAEVLGPTPDGYRINFFVKDGRVRGPRIDAIVEPCGGDWMCVRSDGVGAVHIKITLRTPDGALIFEEAGGVFDIGPDGYEKVSSNVFEGSPPFYATPTWSTAHPDWQWLNRCQGIGFGRVALEALRVECDIYIPQVRERFAGG